MNAVNFVPNSFMFKRGRLELAMAFLCPLFFYLLTRSKKKKYDYFVIWFGNLVKIKIFPFE